MYLFRYITATKTINASARAQFQVRCLHIEYACSWFVKQNLSVVGISMRFILCQCISALMHIFICSHKTCGAVQKTYCRNLDPHFLERWLPYPGGIRIWYTKPYQSSDRVCGSRCVYNTSYVVGINTKCSTAWPQYIFTKCSIGNWFIGLT